MHKNIVFIGGIHGVGKGTFCNTLTTRYKIEHLTCSSVLKWQPEDVECTKAVKNINRNQTLLILNLLKIVQANKKYLLDGHLCLLNDGCTVEKIPIDVFTDIKPVAIAVITEDTNKICNRLEQRDKKKYNPELLNTMQRIEIEHANWVANKLNISFFEIQNVEDKKFKEYLNAFTCTN